MARERLLYTPQAVADLDSIWDYVSSENLSAADRLLDELHTRFVLLSQNPEMGELQPNLADGHYRRFVFKKYVIYYVALKDGIILVRILHGAQEPERRL